jgi:glycosyltransferase involved in cell wall biosynthesis
VDALARLRAEGANVCLVHIGRRGKGIDLEQRALEHGVADRFYHPGPVNYFDTPEVYASADIFLFPSKQETFGNVTVEAMSSGLPCVEFDYGANHDKIDPGHDGFIVPFGDLDAFVAHIRTLLEDDELRRQIGKAARLSMENKFTWETVTAKYREAIHALALKNDERATPSYGRSALNATQQINTNTRK